MRKKYTFILHLLLWSIVLPSSGGAGGGLYAQNEPDFAWVKRFGNSNAAFSGIAAPVIAVDAQGNSYVAGGFFGQSFTLDGITLTPPITIPSWDRPCGYIAKYDPQGQIVWAKSMARVNVGSSLFDPQYNSQKIIVDEEGNIYICGIYSVYDLSNINGHYLTNSDEIEYIEDGDLVYPVPQGSFKAFLAKLDSNGNVLWAKKANHPLYNLFLTINNLKNATNEIYFDSDGNINMTGGFSDYITFSPNDTLTVNTGQAGVYLARYSPQGEVLSAKTLAGSYPVSQYKVELVRTDASGNLYRWSNQWYPHTNKLYRYDAFGEPTDSLTLNVSTTATFEPMLSGFAVSSTGDVFIGGSFFKDITIEGTTYTGAVITTLQDGIVFKLAAPAYEVEWADTYTSNATDFFENLLTDGLGNLYTAGRRSDSGQNRILLNKYTGSGQLLWEKTIESPEPALDYGGPYVGSLYQTKNGGNIWLSGMFRKNAYFAEGYHFTTPGNSHYNGFLVQYGLCDTENPVIDVPASTRICEGGSLELSATLSDPELTYFWSTPTGNVAITDTGTTTLTVTQPGKYYLVAQEDDECYGKSQEVWVTQVLLNNEVTLQDQTLTATEAGDDITYQWLDCNNDNNPVEGATEQSFTPLVSGLYAVEITDSVTECSVVSDCYAVTVENLSCTAQTLWNGTEWSNGLPDADKKAVIEGDLTVTGTMVACELLLNSGIVTISSGAVLTVNGAIENTQSPENFIVQNGANLIQTYDVENTGEIKVYKNSSQIKHLDYTLWASPVSGQGLRAFSEETLWYRIYDYNGQDDVWEQVFASPEDNDKNFESGIGYMFRAPNDFVTAPYTYNGMFKGVPDNGNITVSFDLQGEYQGTGNPYPSNIGIEDFRTTNPGVGALYFWTNTNPWDSQEQDYEYNNWAIYSGMVGLPAANDDDTNIPNGIIPVGQGFMIEAPTLLSVTFTNAMRTSNPGVFFKSMEENKHRLWLSLSDQTTTFNQTVVGYMNGATQDFDLGIDAKLFGYSGSALYSLIDNNENKFAIQGRALPFDDNDVVPLGFRATEAGGFTVSLTDFDGLFAEGQDIYLKDNFTQTEQNLKDGSYAFVSQEGIFDNRFEITYKQSGTLSTTTPNLNHNWVVYKKGETFEILSQGFEMNQVILYDMLGRTIYSSQANGNKHSIPYTGANQVLIVKIITTNNEVLSKKVK
ncbi:MAG: hypothetical protein WDA29_01475 [Flavobacteriaceae bacterium]